MMPMSLPAEIVARILSGLAELPLLATLIGIPLAGALLIALLPSRHDRLVRTLSLLTHLLALLVALLVLLAATFGLAATAMFFMVGFIFHRTRTTELASLGGLFDAMPLVGAAFFISALAIVGMPGTPGFDAAHLILEAAIRRSFGALPTVATALGNVAAAGFLLWAFQRAFLAPPLPGAPEVERTQPREAFIALVAVAVLLIAGFWSEPWMHLTDLATQAIAAPFSPDSSVSKPPSWNH